MFDDPGNEPPSAFALDLLGVPIAAVGHDWLENEFLPAVDEKLKHDLAEGGALWISTDSGSEAEYLLTKIAHALRTAGADPRIIQVDEPDPLLFWENFLGIIEESDRISILPQHSVILAYGGHFLPQSFLQGKISPLEKICRAFNWRMIIPMLQSVSNEVFGSRRLSDHSLIQAPSLINPTDTDDDRLKRLTELMVTKRVLGLTPQSRAYLVDRLLRKRPPSRAQLEIWIDFYRADDPYEVERRLAEHEPPPREVVRLPTLPAVVPTQDTLRRRYSAAWERLLETDERFRSWCGESLLEWSYVPQDPFLISPDPAYWFSALVSLLYNVVFDAGGLRLEFLSGYRYNSDLQDVVADARPPFFGHLRSLRIFMQHALDNKRDHDQQTIQRARAWLHHACGSGQPQRCHWRRLAHQLLIEWDRIGIQLFDVAEHLQGCPSEQAIDVSWRLRTAEVSRQTVRKMFADVAANIDPGINSSRLADKRYDEIIASLRRMVGGASPYPDQVRDLIQTYIIDESARCPISVEDLQKVNVPAGELRGRLLQFARDEWRKNPCMTKDAMLNCVLELYNRCSEEGWSIST